MKIIDVKKTNELIAVWDRVESMTIEDDLIMAHRYDDLTNKAISADEKLEFDTLEQVLAFRYVRGVLGIK